jgi:hypothetical protein
MMQHSNDQLQGYMNVAHASYIEDTTMGYCGHIDGAIVAPTPTLMQMDQ